MTTVVGWLCSSHFEGVKSVVTPNRDRYTLTFLHPFKSKDESDKPKDDGSSICVIV